MGRKPTLLMTAFAALAVSACSSAPLETRPAETMPESTSARIRKAAGLANPQAVGQINVLDIGHHPSDPMVSIVASKSGSIWHVSYACAFSYRCATTGNHRSAEYKVSAAQSADVDRVIDRIRIEKPASVPRSPTVITGRSGLLLALPDFSYEMRNDGAQFGLVEDLAFALSVPLKP